MTTALITGGTAGIGKAFATELAGSRHELIVVARDSARLDAVAEEMRGRGARSVEKLPADLSTQEGRATVEQRLRDAERPVDLLINNAGFGLGKAFRSSSVEDEETLLDVHVRATMRLTHAALRGTGVRCMALCHGVTHTEFHERAQVETTDIPSWMWLNADDVVKAAMRDLSRGVPVSIPGAQYKALTAASRYVPRAITTRISRARSKRW
jgi:short-subunit dehydrogenase